MKIHLLFITSLALAALSTFNSTPRRNEVKAGQLAATWLLVLLLLAAINASLSTAFAQGSLTPPGAPAPTMKSLDQIEARTPISSAPFSITQPGSYYLTTNLNVTSGDAIDINTNGVTLDLNGFTISSTENPAVASDGISLGAVTNIAIYNGHISSGVTNNGSGVYSGSGFGLGIFGSGFPYNVRVSDVSVSGCQYDGIYLGYNSTTVKSCVVNTVGAYGIVAQSVCDSTANDCGSTAISAATANNCYGSSSGSGTGVSAETAINCRGSSNSGAGLNASVANNCVGQSSSGYGLYASATASGCDGTTASGIAGLFANAANNCYGQCNGFQDGLNAVIANNCYGKSSSGRGVVAFTASNCYGFLTDTNGGTAGVDATIANNCFGESSGSGYGVDATIANNCNGTSLGTGVGVYADRVAIGCYGVSYAGIGLVASIANSCDGSSLNVTHKYNMP